MTNKNWNTIFVWAYRTCTYIFPAGIVLWDFLIAKLLDNNVTITQKLGLGGIVGAVVVVIIAGFLLGRYMRKKIKDLTNECIECIDDTKKKELVQKKKQWESRQEIFHNVCVLIPFIVVWVLLIVVEKGVVSLRGTFCGIVVSMSAGLGLNVVAERFSLRGNDNENTRKNQND